MLAEQFEQDADAAGFGQEIRDEEIGNIDDAIVAALGKGPKMRQQELDLVKRTSCCTT